MPLLPMSDLLQAAYTQGYAVPAFCVWGAEAAQTVLRTAEALRAPVILMHGPAEFTMLPPATLGAVVRALVPQYDVQTALLLDHGDSLQRVEDCLAAGYTSLMLDYSTQSLEDNVAAVRQVVERAHPLGVAVEGELGVVGRASSAAVEGGQSEGMTDPDEAAEYVVATGVDALAVAIGNAHGAYTRLPRLDFGRLERLREATNRPLVLHGGSGTPDDDLARAISLGIAKVNVATDLVTAVRTSLLEQWQAGEHPWIPHAHAVAMERMAAVVAQWIERTGAAGRSV